jgi:hypothetical protein
MQDYGVATEGDGSLSACPVYMKPDAPALMAPQSVEVNIGLPRPILPLVNPEAMTEPPERLGNWLTTFHRGVGGLRSQAVRTR